MGFRNWKTVLAVTAGLAALISCKKDDEDETLPSLDGSLRLNYTEFEYLDVSTEESRTVTFVPRGISHPEGGTITYSYTISPEGGSSSGDVAEDGSYEYTFKDSLGVYTVTCTASASGYYSSSASYYATVVSRTGSVTNLGTENLSSITDARDGKSYKITQDWGSYDWFCENLTFAGEGDEVKGVPYRNAEVMSDIFGLFYTSDELDGICPEGWTVPDEAAWDDLAKALRTASGNTPDEDDPDAYYEGIAGMMMADAYFNTVKMWEFWPEVDITNESGLAMIPVGFANIAGGTRDFSGLLTYAAFWTSDTDASNSERAIYKYLICGTPDVMTGAGYKGSFAANVRCVRAK